MWLFVIGTDRKKSVHTINIRQQVVVMSREIMIVRKILYIKVLLS